MKNNSLNFINIDHKYLIRSICIQRHTIKFLQAARTEQRRPSSGTRDTQNGARDLNAQRRKENLDKFQQLTAGRGG